MAYKDCLTNVSRLVGSVITCLVLGIALLSVGTSAALAQDIAVLGVQFRFDHSFPEYECFWHDEGYPNNCGTSSPMGASIHVFIKNNSASTVTLQDVEFAGISLKLALTLMTNQTQVSPTQPASIYLSQAAGLITTAQLNTLIAAGEPVWYKLEPSILPPGTTAQAVVRLRQTPAGTSNINIVHSVGSTQLTIPKPSNPPEMAGITFSADLTKVYLYTRHAQPGQAPTHVYMDGTDVTTNVTTAPDATLRIVPSVLQLTQPLTNGSFHVYQCTFANGQSTMAGVRTWSNNEIIYGIWGAAPGNSGQNDIAKAYLEDVASHLLNTIVQTLGSKAVQDYLKSTEGQAFAAALGLGFVIDAPNKWWVTNPRLFFIRDEPDCLDYNVTGITGDKKPGVIGQWCLSYANTYLGIANHTATLNLLNIDNTNKPYNFYNYGQLADVMCTDPYYQIRLRKAYWDAAWRVPLYAKADYVYAMSQIAKSSSEPNPLHVVLYSCSYVEGSKVFPFPTPQCKRIEVFYALAAGAKGLSYWWYTPQLSTYTAYGVGAGTLFNDADANALWKEIAMLGSQTRTAGPVVVRSTPADLNIQATSGLWVRSLIAGLDTVVLLAVNDNYMHTDTGIQFTPIPDASASVTLPAWLSSPTAFEITPFGTRDLATQRNGQQFQVNLGPVGVTRMIVLTSDAQLRASLQSRYEQQYAAKVQAIAGELGACCVDDGDPPGICVITSLGDCVNNMKGSFKGPGTTCNVSTCIIPADFDEDLDVDQSDFGRMQACLGTIDVANTDPSCAPADLDNSNNVDFNDLLLFETFITGPKLPAN